jgi:hypothetical protein
MGLLPITQFNGKTSAQYRNPQDAELRIDFVTSMNRSDKPVIIPNLNIALEPLKFMEFSLQDTTQACVISRTGACTANIPAPHAMSRGKGWQSRAKQGLGALLRIAPELEVADLWG